MEAKKKYKRNCEQQCDDERTGIGKMIGMAFTAKVAGTKPDWKDIQCKLAKVCM